MRFEGVLPTAVLRSLQSHPMAPDSLDENFFELCGRARE